MANDTLVQAYLDRGFDEVEARFMASIERGERTGDVIRRNDDGSIIEDEQAENDN